VLKLNSSSRSGFHALQGWDSSSKRSNKLLKVFLSLI